MTDLERTRKWLQSCRARTNEDLSENEEACEGCPYCENGACSPWAMYDDALTLLDKLEHGK